MENLKELRENIKMMIADNDVINIEDILDCIHYENISDIYSIYAEGIIPTSNDELIKALKDTDIEDYMQEAINSINIKNYDLYVHIEAAYYLMIKEELNEKDTEIKDYYIVNSLIEEHDITYIEDTVYEDLINIYDLIRIKKISQLDDIVRKIAQEVR